MTREEMNLCLDELELRIGKCSGLDAVKEYIRILPPGDYATSRLLFFSEATDQDQLLERCLTEVAIQDCLLRRLKGTIPFMPAKYLKSEKYLKIRAKIEQEYLDLIESNPDIETKLQALCRKEEVQG